MIFEKYLLPDEMLDNFECLTPEHLIELGVKFIYSDIDNTLATYDDMTPPDNVVNWCRKMNENGITVTFVSNNHRERVEMFNSVFGYKAYPDAKKPYIKVLKTAMKNDGAKKENSILLGDQLLTDNAAAKRMGLYSVIVPPIKDKKTLFFKSKRLIEKPYVQKFRKIHNQK